MSEYDATGNEGEGEDYSHHLVDTASALRQILGETPELASKYASVEDAMESEAQNPSAMSVMEILASLPAESSSRVSSPRRGSLRRQSTPTGSMTSASSSSTVRVRRNVLRVKRRPTPMPFLTEDRSSNSKNKVVASEKDDVDVEPQPAVEQSFSDSEGSKASFRRNAPGLKRRPTPMPDLSDFLTPSSKKGKGAGDDSADVERNSPLVQSFSEAPESSAAGARRNALDLRHRPTRLPSFEPNLAYINDKFDKIHAFPFPPAQVSGDYDDFDDVNEVSKGIIKSEAASELEEAKPDAGSTTVKLPKKAWSIASNGANRARLLAKFKHKKKPEESFDVLINLTSQSSSTASSAKNSMRWEQSSNSPGIRSSIRTGRTSISQQSPVPSTSKSKAEVAAGQPAPSPLILPSPALAADEFVADPIELQAIKPAVPAQPHDVDAAPDADHEDGDVYGPTGVDAARAVAKFRRERAGFAQARRSMTLFSGGAPNMFGFTSRVQGKAKWNSASRF